MRGRALRWSLPLAAVLILCLPATVLAQADASASQPMVHSLADSKFAPVPGMPNCAQAAVQSGDPAKGASVLLAKMAPDCSIPWHWHTPTEQLMVVSGVAHVQAKDGQQQELQAGSFAMMPAKHVHQFHCAKACTLFIQSDGVFDMHYVDAQGKELTPEQALQAVKETPAKGPAKTGSG